MIPGDVNCRRLLHLVTDRFQMGTQIFIEPHPLQYCRLLFGCHALRVENGYLEQVQGWGSGTHYQATEKGRENPVKIKSSLNI